MIDFHFYRFIDLSMAYISIINYCKLIQLDSRLSLRYHRYLILSRNVFNFRGRNTHRFVRKRQKKRKRLVNFESQFRDRANHSIISHEKSSIIIIFLKSPRRREKLQ